MTCGSRCRRTTHYVRGRCRAGGICADLFRTGWIVSRSSDLTAYNAYSYSSSHPSAGRRSRNTRHTLGRAQDQPVCLLTLLQGFRGAAAAGRLLAALLARFCRGSGDDVGELRMSEESSLSFSGLVIGAAVIAGAPFQTYFLKIVVVVVVFFFFFGRRVGAPENVGAVVQCLLFCGESIRMEINVPWRADEAVKSRPKSISRFFTCNAQLQVL